MVISSTRARKLSQVTNLWISVSLPSRLNFSMYSLLYRSWVWHCSSNIFMVSLNASIAVLFIWISWNTNFNKTRSFLSQQTISYGKTLLKTIDWHYLTCKSCVSKVGLSFIKLLKIVSEKHTFPLENFPSLWKMMAWHFATVFIFFKNHSTFISSLWHPSAPSGGPRYVMAQRRLSL